MTKIHDNEFSLKMAGLSNFTFVLNNEDNHSITPGQPWEGITTKFNSSEAIITARAGRNSDDKRHTVRDWFIRKLEEGSCLGNSSSGSVPGDLNFAFIGTMSFDHANRHVKCENVLIAQGHSTRNTWWLGGPRMSGMDTPLGGMIKAKTQNIIQFVTFAEFAGYISHMDMGVI